VFSWRTYNHFPAQFDRLFVTVDLLDFGRRLRSSAIAALDQQTATTRTAVNAKQPFMAFPFN